VAVGPVWWIESRYEVSLLLQPDRISEWLNDAGRMAPLLFIGIMTAAVVISPIPSLPLDIAAGTVFGPIAGTLRIDRRFVWGDDQFSYRPLSGP